MWPRTSAVALEQTISEQLPLVAERPEVSEVQFTAAGFGWVVVYLDKIDLDKIDLDKIDLDNIDLDELR